MTRRQRRVLALCIALGAPIAPACGARTGFAPPPLPVDAAVDQATTDALDEAVDVRVVEEPDAFEEPPADVVQPIDVNLPEAPDLCPDAGETLVYVITTEDRLYSFYPPTLAFELIGTVQCHDSEPFSMAVNRQGIAFSVFQDGTLFRIDTATAACQATTYAIDQLGFLTFGMGYAADTNDAGETLYVAQAVPMQTSHGLATIDTTTMKASFVGQFTPPIPGAELTGTGDGRLFAFFTNPTGSGSHIVEVDRMTGAILGDNPLMVGAPNDGYAFAFWGGVFWVFTEQGGPTTVTRFDPSTKSETTVTTMNDTVVGAGVSTCAPQ
jgi:hypothetical protein